MAKSPSLSGVQLYQANTKTE